MSSLFVLNPIFMRRLNFLFISAISLASCSDMSFTYDIQTGNKIMVNLIVYQRIEWQELIL